MDDILDQGRHRHGDALTLNLSLGIGGSFGRAADTERL